MKVVVILIAIVFVAALFFAIGYVVRARQSSGTLTGAERRMIAHALTKEAERSRMDSQALQQVGFDQPAVIDRASDLKALADKVKNLE